MIEFLHNFHRLGVFEYTGGHQKAFSDPADWDLGSHKGVGRDLLDLTGLRVLTIQLLTFQFNDDESQQSQFL